MKRDIDIRDISDGKFYTAKDLVKADCQDCAGCSDCCHGMGESIVLDPLDVVRLTQGTGLSLEELLHRGYLEMNLVDGVILPNLKMKEGEESCGFLDTNGRCTVHAYRPGICRMFPLGRYYEEQGFRYILQVHECSKSDRTKIKVKKWLDTPDLKSYESYIWNWHRLLVTCGEAMGQLEAEQIRIFNLYLLKTFYQTPFSQEFYEEFSHRLQQVKETLGL